MSLIRGDPELGQRLRTALGRRHAVAAGATVAPSGLRTASVGAELSADYEIGSISKAVTGLLYAEALERHEIDSCTTLGDLLPLAGAPAAGVTLAALSTHSSGLPRLPSASAPLRRTLRLWRDGTNPYGEGVELMLEQARRTPLGRARPRYSNLGFELLGHALASAAGVDYPDLVRRRLAEPLGLSGFYAPSTVADLRPGAVAGRSRRGRSVEPWTGAALAPAGGLRATIGDLAGLLQALLDGTAPGGAALEPVAELSGHRVLVGAAWITLRHRDRWVTWHNGGTGGFRSWIGLDRERRTGVAVLSATAAAVDRHGFRLLAELAG